LMTSVLNHNVDYTSKNVGKVVTGFIISFWW
jgi:hypothetical protein